MRRPHGIFAISAVFSLLTEAHAGTVSSLTSPPSHQRSAHTATLHSKKHKLHSVNAHSTENLTVSRGNYALRKARSSISPVDIISSKDLHRTGQINIADALARVNPSVTIGTAGWDAGAFTSSIRLRGLNPNHTLVLINGKRRHTTASIYADSGPQEGSSPVDLNMIPAEAIDHIEVLRDGSGAEYGADAIAGVINIVLKRTTSSLEADAQTGANAYNGDGWQYQFGFDGGLPIGDDGFINLSGQMYHTDHFIQKAIDDRTGKMDDPALSLSEETRQTASINFGKDLAPGLQAYGFATYAHRHGESLQDYRTPDILPQLYPEGFVPIEALEEQDYAATIGLKGHVWGGFRWDLSSTYGADNDHMSLKNTGNPALYNETGSTPTHVRTESFRHAQWTNDLTIHRRFLLSHEQKIDLSFGAQHRLDTYRIGAGDPASYLEGGTQGFAGLMPENSGKWDRDVWSGYIDSVFHITRKLNLDLGGRIEHYTDVGNSQTGKVALRYDINRYISARATLNNGFRAPTLLEEHYSALNVTPFGATANLPVNSSAASSLGANRLKPERSTNVSGGFVLEPIDKLHVSIDAYQINIRDRIVPGGSYQGNAAEHAIALTGASLPSGLTSDNVTATYFTNGASTRTQGLDIMASYPLHFRHYGTLNLSMALNLNRTRIHHVGTDGNGNPQLNAQQIGYLTTASPRSKIILNALWNIGKWDINLRQTRYGETVNNVTYQDAAPPSLQYSQTQFHRFVNPPAWLTDLEIGYQITRRFHAAIGANNIFNVRPRRMPPENSYLGTLYYDNNSSGIPMTGGYYYGRINLSL